MHLQLFCFRRPGPEVAVCKKHSKVGHQGTSEGAAQWHRGRTAPCHEVVSQI